MNSSILQFFNVKLDAFIVFFSVIFVIMLITLFFLLLDYLKMRKRYVEFMTGESGKSLEYTIYKRFREIDDLKINQKDNDDQIAIIYNLVRKSYNKIGIYRYDAYSLEKNVTGGALSFVLTLLNSENDGFIINTIHNRAGCHMYMKEIKNATCDVNLSEEETVSLNMALNYGKKAEKIEEEGSSKAQSEEPKAAEIPVVEKIENMVETPEVEAEESPEVEVKESPEAEAASEAEKAEE